MRPIKYSTEKVLMHCISLIAILLLNVGLTHSQSLDGYWEGNISYQGKTWSFATEFEKTDNNELQGIVDFIEIGGYRRVFKISRNGSTFRMERPQPDGRPPLIFNGELKQKEISGTFDGIGIKGAVFTLTPAEKVAFITEEVVFDNESIRLSGTLLCPISKERVPAVVFTHGSDPDTRVPYYGMAMSFVKQGIAALIYDKRSIGESKGGDYTDAGFTDFAKDALAGIKLLKGNKRINSDQIGVFGHSQGGWIAPTAAGLSADVAFVITSAASGITATEQSVYHRANVMRREGFSEDVVAKAADIRIRFNAATKTCFTDTAERKKAIKLLAEELQTIKNEAWFVASGLPEIPNPNCPSPNVMELLFREPYEIWSKVKVPVYAVWGQQDYIVPIEKIHVITDALNKAGNKMVFTKVIPDTDHSILVIRSDPDWDFPRESPQYFTDMAKWVNDTFKNK